MQEKTHHVCVDHLPSLDGLRGIAALWVMLSHVQILTGLKSIPIISWGGLAVDLFMLLSGFLMAHHYFQRSAIEPWGNPSTAIKFWIRRFFRIAPAYYVLLALALPSGPWLGDFRTLIANIWPNTSTPVDRYIDHSIENVGTHLSFVFGFLPNYAFRTPLPDWSIGLEMQYYLVFPAIMLLIARLGAIASTLLLLGISALVCLGFEDFVSKFQMPSFLPMKLYMFIIGIWIAIGRERNRMATGLAISTMIAVVLFAVDHTLIALSRLLLILGIYYLLDTGNLPFHQHLAPTVGRLRALLSCRFSRFLGDTSYSVYLLHLIILLPIAGTLIKHEWYLSLNPYGRFVICTLGAAPLAYFFSFALFWGIEKPGIRVGKRFLSLLNSK